MATLAEWRGWLVTSGAFLGVVAVTVAATLPSAAEAAGTYRSSVTATAGAPVRWPSWATRWPGGWGSPWRPPSPSRPTTWTSTTGPSWPAACCAPPSTGPTACPTRWPPPATPSAPASSQWPALWQGNVAQFRPNVVVVLAGRWEVMDRLVDGTWSHIGQPSFDAAGARRRSSRRCTVASSSGAYVVMLTAPVLRLGGAAQRHGRGRRTIRPASTATTSWSGRWPPSTRPPCGWRTSTPWCAPEATLRHRARRGAAPRRRRRAHRPDPGRRSVAGHPPAARRWSGSDSCRWPAAAWPHPARRPPGRPVLDLGLRAPCRTRGPAGPEAERSAAPAGRSASGCRRGRGSLVEDRAVGALALDAQRRASTDSGTRLISDRVVISDSHWMSW